MGLESYVAEGAVDDADTLREFAENVLLESAGPLDGVYLREAHSCASAEAMDRLRELDRAYSAAKPVAPLREASRTVGRQFLRTVTGCCDHAFLGRYEDVVRSGRSPGHYALALGVAAHALGIGVRQALQSHFYGVVTGLASAAVRLIPLGQTDGQRVLAETEAAATAAVALALALPVEEAYSTGPGHEVRSMTHKRLHTRLFVT